MNIPEAKVKPPALVKYGRVVKQWRRGRGFSIGELKKAGLTVNEARKLGLRIDKRRKSIHEENVETLKRILSEIKQEGK